MNKLFNLKLWWRTFRHMIPQVYLLVWLPVAFVAMPLHASIPESGYYYLYCEQSGGFLSRGGSNGVMPVIDELGVPFTLTTPENGARRFLFLDNSLYLYETESGLATDGSAYRNLSITEVSEGQFTLKSYYKRVYPAVDAWLGIDNGVVVLTTDEQNAAIWCLKSADEQKDIVARKAEQRIRNIAAKGGLEVQTQADLESILQGYESIDATNQVTNAALTANSNGWTLNLKGATSALNWGKYTIASNNYGAMTLTQTVTGLKRGFYRVTLQAFYRGCKVAPSMTAGNLGFTMTNAILQAGDNYVPIVDWYTIRDSDTKPDSRGDISDFSLSKYTNTLYTYVGWDGKLTLTIDNPSYFSSSGAWFNFNNLTLTYYDDGHSDDDLKTEPALEAIDQYMAYNKTADTDYDAALTILRQTVLAATANEQIEQAIATLPELYRGYISRLAPTDKAIDITDIIHNSDFAQYEEGWNISITNPAGYNKTYKFYTAGTPHVFEAYAGYSNFELSGFDVNQTITLPAGMYRINVQSFYRYGLSYNTDLTELGHGISRSYLYAGSDRQPVKRLGDIVADTYANDLQTASAELGQGLYPNSLVFTLDAEETVAIGVCGTYEEKTSWSAIGPFTLEKVSQSVLDAEESQLFDGLKRQYADYLDALAAIASPSDSYSEFAKQVAAAKTTLSGADEEAAMQAICAEVRGALIDFIATHNQAGERYDITPLIDNPDFADGISGWVVNGMQAVSGGIVEAFNKQNASISQTLQGMPAGVYELKVQAFHRTAGYLSTIHPYEAGTEVVTASLVGNSGTNQPLLSIHDARRYTPALSSGSVEGAYNQSIPNTAQAASAAFADGLYWNSLFIDQVQPGELNIGVALTNGQASNWVALDNFRLYYGAATEEVNVNTATDGLTLPADAVKANLNTDLVLQAGRLNAVCLPSNMPASTFDNVYVLAEVKSDGTNATATMVPVPDNATLQAGHVYFVQPNSDCSNFSLSDIYVSVAKPDCIPVLWEGGATTGDYSPHSWKGAYTISTGGELTLITSDEPTPAFTGVVYVADDVTAADNISIQFADWNNLDVTVNLENQPTRSYLSQTTYTGSADASTIGQYAISNPPARLDHPHTVLLPLPEQGEGLTLEYKLIAAQEGTPTEETIHTVGLDGKQPLYELANLIPAATYSYEVKKNGTVVSAGNIHTTGHLRMIKAVTGNNIRDLGGWAYTDESDGPRVKYGKLYRGGEMNGDHQIDEYDRELLRALGVKAELDIREDVDITNYTITESALGSDIDYIYMNQHGHSSTTVATDSITLGKAFLYMLNNLRRGYPVYFHCYWGADRTAMYAMLYLGVLGVSVGDIYKDYELTTFSNAGSRVKTSLDSKIEYIQSLPGTTFKEQCYYYWTRVVGISTQDVDEYIRIMTDPAYEPITTSIPVAGYYYLYDSAAGQFLGRGGTDGTKPVLDQLGTAVLVNTPEQGTRTIMFLDNRRYLGLNGENIGTENHEGYGWNVTELADGQFTIAVADIDDGSDTKSYLVNAGGQLGLQTAEPAQTWLFVTPERHNSLVASARDQRIKTLAANAGIDVETESELAGLLATYRGIDKTSAIENAALTANSNGWTLNLNGATSAVNWGKYTMASNNYGAMTLAQTITGLPSGLYRVTMQGFQRMCSNTLSMQYGNKGISMANATLTANDNFTPLLDWYSIRDSETLPNSRGDISDFTQQKYTNSLYTYVGDDGVLYLEFCNPSYLGSSASWTNFNGVTLTYYDNQTPLQPGDDLTAAITNAACAGLDGWHITSGANGALQVDTWSSSGSKDGTGMSTPFIEYWISSSSGTLADASVYHDPVAHLQPGTYRLTALVRLCSESGASTISAASMYANNSTLDLTQGTPYTYSGRKGIYGTYELDFVVGDDGMLNFGFTVKNATFNWLAFKNVKLTYIAPPSPAVSIDRPDYVGKGTTGVVYNIAGQRLSGLQKGVNIVDGNKVLIR